MPFLAQGILQVPSVFPQQVGQPLWGLAHTRDIEHLHHQRRLCHLLNPSNSELMLKDKKK